MMKLLKVLLPSAFLLFPQFADANTQLITSGTSTTVPATWNNSNNKIECWGSGAGGESFNFSSKYGGGGSGGYSIKNNVTLVPGNTINYFIGAAGHGETGSANATAGAASGLCSNNGTCTSCTAGTIVVCANGGSIGASGGTGGAGASTTGAVGDTKVAGCAGGSTTNVHSGAGGGGAGLNAGIGTCTAGGAGTTTTGGAGGNSAGTGGAGGTGSQPGQPGTANTNGGGGGGGGDISGATNGNGGVGALPGGGGGGGSGDTGTNLGGNGGAGQCLLTWTPATTGSTNGYLDNVFFGGFP